MAPVTPSPYILGLDIGSASLGWSLVDPLTRTIVSAGVRIFDAAADPRKFEKGEEGSSNNLIRRTARLHRRQLRRRAARQRELFQTLQRAGFLPAFPSDAPPDPSAARDFLLSRLDAELRTRWRDRITAHATKVAAPEQVLPYFLRARALDAPLDRHELGRALYHLAQRRGFKSNRREGKPANEALGESGRKTGKKQAAEDDRSQVKKDIAGLDARIKSSDARTLGEYLSWQDPSVPKAIRRQWTGRKMFEEEFESIWTKQAEFHPQLLTGGLKQRIWKLLFFQRLIASNEHLIGMCELEPGERRAPMSCLAAQRFRLLQKVNDLEIVAQDFQRRRLSPEERGILLEKLQAAGGMEFSAIRKLLGLPKGTRFNLEAGGEKKLPGNRTVAAMLRAFGERWKTFTPAEHEEIAEVWRTAEDPEELRRVGMERYGLDGESAARWAEAEPEDRYCSLSRKALASLLPLMETGMSFKTAEKEVHGTSGAESKDQLDPVEDALPQIPNPAVKRALTEVRKLVNTICRQHGKPAEIRIELARDIKRNAKQREIAWRGTREQEKRRDDTASKITKETGIPRPSRADIEKALLWEECKGICPYCGESISFQQLFDEHGQAEVEHILPLSRFADNSFGNKTLSHRQCNQEKRGRTPHQAFACGEERWAQILARVAKMGNPQKLDAFKAAAEEDLDPNREDSFAARRLNDTRYSSKLAARYLGQLYGGRDLRLPDGSTRRVIHASSGLVTATLRRAWGLEAILREAAGSANGQNRGKPRTDHRHHAVDATVIALSSNRMIQQLSTAASTDGRISSRTLTPPWSDFVESIRPIVLGIQVSHRPSHKLNGPLHDETNYGKPRADGKKQFVHVRKPVHLLSEKTISAIVDRKVREAVLAKLAEVGDPKKFENNPPTLFTRTGKRVPIRRVRIRQSASVRAVGVGPRERYVAPNNNHHIAFFRGPGKKGKEVWDGIVVSRLEAMQRHAQMKREKRKGSLVEKRFPGQEDYEFLFSLMGGDMVEMYDEARNCTGLFVVRTISESSSGVIEVDFVRHTDARRIADMKETKDWLRVTSMDELRRWNCRKVVVDPLGRVHPAHD